MEEFGYASDPEAGNRAPVRPGETRGEFLRRVGRTGIYRNMQDKRRLQRIYLQRARVIDAAREATVTEEQALEIMRLQIPPCYPSLPQSGDAYDARQRIMVENMGGRTEKPDFFTERAFQTLHLAVSQSQKIGPCGLSLYAVEQLFDVRRIAARRKYSDLKSTFKAPGQLRLDVERNTHADDFKFARLCALYAGAYFGTHPTYLKALAAIGVDLTQLMADFEPTIPSRQ